MTESNNIQDGFGAMLAGNQSLLRLQLEMALESRSKAERPVAETIADAAQAAGADLIFVLPRPDGSGSTAVVRVSEDGLDSFLEVGTTEKGFAVFEQAEMDQYLLRLARAAVDVLERLSGDPEIREPLAAAE